VNVELPDTSLKATANRETTLVGSEGTAHVSVIGDEADGVAVVDLTRVAAVYHTASDADDVSLSQTEGEDDAVVVLCSSPDGGGSAAVDEVLAPGGDGELPNPVSQDDAIVAGGEPQGGWLAVGVGGVGGPAVLQEVVHIVKRNVVEVKSDSHYDGERRVQSVVVVVVIVDEGHLIVDVSEDSLLSIHAESSLSIEVMVDWYRYSVDLITEDSWWVGGEVHAS